MVLRAEALNPLSYAQWKEEYGSRPGVPVQGWLGNDGENREDGGVEWSPAVLCHSVMATERPGED